MLENYQTLYSKIYSKVNLEKILQYYNLDYKSYYSKKGKEYLCSCPFHDDSTPSFSIIDNSGVYNCFVCGGGDFIKFIQNLEKLKTRKDALEYIKQKVGLEESPDIFSIVQNSVDVFSKIEVKESQDQTSLTEIQLPNSEDAEKYFEIVKKRVTLEDIRLYGMRYCIDDKIFHDRLIIPVYMFGKLITFAARDMSGKAEDWGKVKEILKTKKLSKVDKQKITDKYLYKKILYPFGTPMAKIFFNWDIAIKDTKEIVICEGIFDAIKIRKYGYNVVALLSCHLNSYKSKMLMQNFEKIYIALDNDNKIDCDGNRLNPGQDAAHKIMQEYLTDVPVYNIELPLGKDPDDCSKEEFDFAYEASKKMQKMFTLALQ